VKAPSVYIAAPLTLRERALTLAGWLREAGVFVSSTWHASERATVAAELALSEQDQDEIAEQCLREIARSTHVALLCGPRTDRHGNVAEAAYAAGLGLPVVGGVAARRGFGGASHTIATPAAAACPSATSTRTAGARSRSAWRARGRRGNTRVLLFAEKHIERVVITGENAVLFSGVP
jgi:nucleoside 2-deoxyribosyltransferase